MVTKEISWTDIKKLTAVAIKLLVAGHGPEQFRRLYQKMEPKSFAYWLHGFLFASSKVEGIDNRIMKKFVADCLKEYF